MSKDPSGNVVSFEEAVAAREADSARDKVEKYPPGHPMRYASGSGATMTQVLDELRPKPSFES